jgi:hypothetical protein
MVAIRIRFLVRRIVGVRIFVFGHSNDFNIRSSLVQIWIDGISSIWHHQILHQTHLKTTTTNKNNNVPSSQNTVRVLFLNSTSQIKSPKANFFSWFLFAVVQLRLLGVSCIDFYLSINGLVRVQWLNHLGGRNKPKCAGLSCAPGGYSPSWPSTARPSQPIPSLPSSQKDLPKLKVGRGLARARSCLPSSSHNTKPKVLGMR